MAALAVFVTTWILTYLRNVVLFFSSTIIPSNRPRKLAKVPRYFLAVQIWNPTKLQSFELIKFSRSENDVRIRCFFRQLRQLLRTSVVDSLLQLIFKVNVKSSVSFSHLSLSLARADSTRNISVTWREKRDELVRGEPGREAGMDPHEIVG